MNDAEISLAATLQPIADIADTVRTLSNYGSRVKYDHECKGVNSRLDELQAALLEVKLRHLDTWHAGRDAIAKRYLAEIKNPKIKLPELNPDGVHAWHLFPVLTEDRNGLRAYLEEKGISFEHFPSGIDTMTVVVDRAALFGHENELIHALQKAVNPDHIHLVEDLCLIAVVGRGMMGNPGTAARLFNGLAKENINIRMIDQGSSELNIIVALEEKDYEKAIRAIYEAFADAK